MSQNIGNFLRKESVHPLSNRVYIISPINENFYTNLPSTPRKCECFTSIFVEMTDGDTVYLVRTSAGIHLCGAIVPNPRAHEVCYARGGSDAFDDTVYLVRSSPGIIGISCLRRIFPYSLQAGACPRSFFLLFAECEALVRFFFFLERRKKNAKSILKEL